MMQPGVTLCHLIIAHDTRLLVDWDHTSYIYAAVYNLSCLVSNLGGKSRAKPRSPSYFHPYRERKIEGMKVTPKNISSLKLIAYALSRK